MYYLKDLEQNIHITDSEVECPKKDCRHVVERMKKNFRAEEEFKCPDHGIYISPTTFEYEDEQDNLLWKDKEDLELLRKVKLVKRESRMARDNSEDAVTWNVFRFLDRNNLVGPVLGSVIGVQLDSPEVIYWSYSPIERCSWKELDKARVEFGEKVSRSSEPDLIVASDDVVVVVEAKVLAPNVTAPSDPENRKRYEPGGGGWFNKAFSSSYQEVVTKSGKYELMRFWLLGTWIADQLDRDFYLVNLVLDGREANIIPLFTNHINENEHAKFMRITWEDLYRVIASCDAPAREKAAEMEYFNNKTLGYYRGQIRKAFSLP